MSRRAMVWKAGVGLAALIVFAGCASTQPKAIEAATHRWNAARAQVKTRLASDQFAAGHTEAAAAELAEAYRLDPENEQLILLQARIWLAQGRLGEAEKLLETTELEGKAQAEVLYLRGVVRQQQQQWFAAQELFERAAALDEDEIVYLVAAVQMRLQIGSAQVARHMLEQAAPRFGWTSAYQAALAECHEQVGDWSVAALAWERVAAAPEADDEVRRRLAQALYRAGRYEDAATALSPLVAACDAEVDELLTPLLIQCHLELGQADAARRLAENYVRLRPEDGQALRLLAHATAQAGDYESALRTARRALAQNARDPAALELCTALAWHTGRRDDSLAMARKLVALDRENAVAKHVIAEAAAPR